MVGDGITIVSRRALGRTKKCLKLWCIYCLSSIMKGRGLIKRNALEGDGAVLGSPRQCFWRRNSVTSELIQSCKGIRYPCVGCAGTVLFVFNMYNAWQTKG